MSKYREGTPFYDNFDRLRSEAARGPPVEHHPFGRFEVSSIPEQSASQSSLINRQGRNSTSGPHYRIRLTTAPSVGRLKRLPRADPPLDAIADPSDLVILVTYDGVEYHARKSILCSASPLLKYEIPLASTRKDIRLISDSGIVATEGKKIYIGALRRLPDGTPRILLNENSKTLRALLYYVYGSAGPFPDIDAIADPTEGSPFLQLVPAYEMAVLLGFNHVSSTLKLKIKDIIAGYNFGSASPAAAVRAYIVASQLGLEDAMLDTAFLTLFDPLDCTEINYMNLDRASRCRLVKYRRECAKAVMEIFNRGLPDEHISLIECSACAARPILNGGSRIAVYWRKFCLGIREEVYAAPMKVFDLQALPMWCWDAALACRKCSDDAPENFKSALRVLQDEANDTLSELQLDFRPPGSWSREEEAELSREFHTGPIHGKTPQHLIWDKLEDR